MSMLTLSYVAAIGLAVLAAVGPGAALASPLGAGATCIGADRDLPECRERRLVAAAERLNDLTRIGIIVSGVSTLAVVITVGVSTLATMAATTAARAAKEAVEHERLASAKELRPYMIPRLEVARFLDDGKPVGYQFSIAWLNAGKTPAINCSYSSSTFGSFDTITNMFDFPTGEIFSTGVIMQNDFQKCEMSGFSLEALHPIFSGEMVFLVYGWIDYSELGSSRRFRTEYACRVTCSADPLSADDANFRPSPLIRFNGMDQDCLRTPQPYTPRQRPLAPTPMRQAQA